MDAVKNDVKRLVKIELAAANKKFRMFAGPHEGAGIIQEEVVEAVQEMNGLRQELNAMWIGAYSNNPQISTKGVYDRAVARSDRYDGQSDECLAHSKINRYAACTVYYDISTYCDADSSD